MSAKKGNIKIANYTDWMSQLPSELWTIPLFKLAIPGSHDSVSYDLDASSAIIEPDNLKRFSWIYCLRRIVRTWGMTQEYNITMQLEAGVRYFDLRIARKRNDHHPTRLYFYHGLYTSTDVETVLGEIHAWTVAHPKEVIILAFSNFNGFEKNIKDKLHNHLIGFIKTMFGSTLVPR
uniref:PI-PLC X domain-containing protein 1-like n=1 Tax=Maylandia zebra TaxID=106582 RepID=UPI000D32658F|nr:PI-PLC X domain-containing protein 1-like [Maylandia zebra]